MSTNPPQVLQFRRGTTAEISSITGAEGELFVDLDKNVVVVMDGTTEGGYTLQPELLSGTNIKTINNESILGSGNIDITSAEWGNITGTLSSQTDLQNALDDKLESGDITDFETTSQLNARDTANRDRTNHTGTQAISTVDGLQSALNDKQDELVSGTNIKTVNGNSLLGSGDVDLSTNLILVGNELRYTNIDGTLQTVDLSAYLDDTTNTIVSGTLNGNIITFTREDATTFDVDVTALYDDTNLVTSVNGNTGAIVVQETLVSGTNIKTVNGTSILGAGDVDLSLYTSSDFDTDFSSKSTSDLSEGTNLYYTDARVDAHLSGGTGVTYSSGAISIGQDVGTSDDVQFDSLGVGTVASGTTGEIRATNDITAFFSDDRLKTRLGTIDSALNKVDTLTAFYYEPNETALELGYKKNRYVGLSAQEVEQILPEVIKPAPIDEEYKTIQYEKLVPLLVAAIQELKQEIGQLKAK